MTSLLIRLYRYFRSHRTVCWLSLAALFVCFGYFASQIHLEEDIDKLMPSSRNEDGTVKLAFADLKIKDKVFLLFEGSDPHQLIDVCDAFADSVMQRDSASHTIGDIFYRLDEDLVPDAVDYLMDHFPAYIDTSAYQRFDTLLTRQHIARQMQANRDDLTGEFGELYPELIQMDPVGLRTVLADQLAPLLSGGSYKTVDGHFFVPDSTVCLSFITPRYSSTNTGEGSSMFRMLNALIRQFSQLHPDVRISYHGTPASGYYNSTQIKHDLTTTIAGAVALVLLFLLLYFRRWSTIPLLLLPVAFGTLFALAVMYWLRGHFSLLALGIGGVVLGVALSYVLHILTHHRYVADGEQLLRDQVKPVLLGCVTTIGSFAGMLFIKTELLQDFGLFAAFAILGTTLFSLTYLPQLLTFSPSSTSSSSSSSSSSADSRHSLSRLLSVPACPALRRLALGVVLLAMACCVGAYFAGGTRFDADMHNLGYDEPLTLHSEELLRAKTYTGDKQKYFASKGRTMDEAIEHFALLTRKLDSLQQAGLVKSYTHTNQILVSQHTQQQRIDAWHDYWTPQRLQLVRRLVAETAPQTGLRADAFEPFFEAAVRDYEPDALYEAGILPTGYLSTQMEQSYDGTWLCFTAVRCQNDSVRSSQSDYIRICDAIASDPALLVLDTYYYTTDTLLQMNADFNVLQWLSMAFVFVVLLLSFRFNIRHTLLGFAPILLSWLIVLGAMVVCDVRFNLISIIISTFIFGIGVDYSIFVMNGLTSPDSRTLHYHKTAVMLSALVLVTTVGSLLLATHPAIRSVGFSTLVGLLAAVVLSYIFQPMVFRRLGLKGEQ